MMKYDGNKFQAEADVNITYLKQALHMCKCNVRLELVQKDLSYYVESPGPDVIVLLCSTGYELDSHVVSMFARDSQNPVILYLADYNEVAELVGLRTGACDVLHSEMSANVMAERIMSVHRRHIINGQTLPEFDRTIPNTRSSGCWIDIQRNEFWIGKKSIEFTKTEIKIIEALMTNSGAIVTRKELSVVLQKFEIESIQPRIVDSHIKRIRTKISKVDRRINLIKTVYGAGYKFMQPRVYEPLSSSVS